MSKKRNQKLVSKIILIAVICVAAVAAALTIIGGVLIDSAYEEMTEEELKATAEQLADLYNYAYEGDWAMNDGTLTKGDEVISGDFELIDDLHARTGLEFTLFYMDTRVLSTMTLEDGSRNIGTTADPTIVSDVVNGKNEHYARNITVGGTVYDIYYIPMLNSDGSCQGMVSTARNSENVASAIRHAVMLMVVFALIGVAAGIIVGLFINKKTSPVMNGIAGELESLASGNLSLTLDESAQDRNDELGNIAESVQNINVKLVDVIKNTQRMSNDLSQAGSDLSSSADQASEASNQVSEAVDEISKGAVSQAESIQTAARDTENIGDDIDVITGHVETLDNATNEMKESCERAMTTLGQLMSQSKEVQESVVEIGKTIDSTNESAKTISEFTHAITDIASQTNLLSLNASIEAARAGEAGRGFAVVATEIGQLAIQSSDSAEKIKGIVDQLLSDAEASVEVMKKLNEKFEVQASQMDSTQNDMHSMAENVTNVSESTTQINARIEELNRAKSNLVDIISDLSAISEENAAATEQTNASMEELNATFNIITESASQLRGLAAEMLETISYFHE